MKPKDRPAGEMVFARTPRGEDLAKMVRLFLKRERVKSPRSLAKIDLAIMSENTRFSQKWKEDGLALICKVFG